MDPRSTSPRIAIVGSGDLAHTLAHRLTSAGYDLAIADLHDRDAAASAAAGSNAMVMSPDVAVRRSDVVFLTLPFGWYRTLHDSRRMQPGTPVHGLASDAEDVRAALEAA